MGFNNIIGHERAIKLLTAMLVNNRLPHALLLTGPAGVGKYMLARVLAQAVNCLENDPAKPCGRCEACRKIEREVHPDVVKTEPEGRTRVIKIDTIRELRNRSAFRPYEGRTKVFIIREADRMMEAAANALLKTLEEPPPDSLIILTAPEESDLLTTIVSRCLRVNLAPLSRETVEAFLVRERGLSGPQARLLASLSAGCLGRVQDMDPEAVWSRRKDLLARLGRSDPGRVDEALDWAADLAADKESWPELFSLLRFWYRDLMIVAGGGETRHLVNSDLAPEIKQAGAGYKTQAFASALLEIDRAEDALNRLIRPEMVFENLALNLADLGRR